MPQINTVAEPIINSPYEDPEFYWHIEAGRQPEKRSGRRPASYFFRVPERAARGRRSRGQVELFEESEKGQEYLLDNANLLRQRIKEWEARNYEGATRVTKELLELWHSDERRQRLFFAQLEAAKIVIFLTEGPQDLLQGIAIPLDEPSNQTREAGYKAFLRYAMKMATGTGKTTVMGMLAAWSILNKVADPQNKRYSDTVLIICPNVTIREQLQELKPERDELSLYRTRELVPLHRMPDLRRGEVIITNWHNLERQEVSSVNGVSAKVVKRGIPVTKTATKTVGGEKVTVEETRYYESDQAYLKRILGGRKGRSQSILVFNDEAHHAYRRGDTDQEEVVLDIETAKKNDREATVWIEGLDKISKVLGGKGNGIRLCCDFSATPFYIQGSGNEVGKPFPWIISDFGLLEAIEAGLVKIPQLPTQDITGAETASYFNIWRWVEEQARLNGHTGALTPEIIMQYATQPITQLAEEWHKTYKVWDDHYKKGLRKSPVPPVFIIVCRDTTVAKEVYVWLTEGKKDYGMAPELFRNNSGKTVTVRIDSRVAEDIEFGGGKDEEKRLRYVLETVGKTEWPGGKVPEEYAALVHKHNQKAVDDEELEWIDETIPPGRDIRCIISVAMLSEGWDATTVTHVVGLRPFGSQLLCEQVVGRALRRTSYTIDEATGKFREETAKVFGVPFELIPFKVEGGSAQPPTPPSNHIYAVQEKSNFEITFPIVEGYHDPGLVTMTLDWDRVPTLVLDPLETPDETLVKGLATQDGRLAAYGPGVAELIDLAAWRGRVRTQQVAFDLAATLTRKWIEERGEAIPKHRLFPQLLEIARKYLNEKLDCKGNRQPCDVALNPYYQRAVDALFDAMTPIDQSGERTELPVIPSGRAGIRSTAYVDFHTGRDLWPVQKCHLNAMVADTQKWEQSAAFSLDTHPTVLSWVKNDHLGFHIRYRKGGAPRSYVPDFIAKLDNGVNLIVEVKGQIGDAETKKAAAQRWVNAMNLDGRYGQWAYEMVLHPANMRDVINRSSIE